MSRVKTNWFLPTRTLLFTHNMNKLKWQLSARALTQWFVASVAQIVHDNDKHFGYEDSFLWISHYFRVLNSGKIFKRRFLLHWQRGISSKLLFTFAFGAMHFKALCVRTGVFVDSFTCYCIRNYLSRRGDSTLFSTLDSSIIDKSREQWFSAWKRSWEFAFFPTKKKTVLRAHSSVAETSLT